MGSKHEIHQGMKILLILFTFLSCQAIKLNKECKLTLDEIKFNWDTSAPSQWNYSCLEFLDRLYLNKNCFVGMDSTNIFKIFGKKRNSDLYQDGKWRIQYAVAVLNMNVYDSYLTLDFVMNKGKVEFVYYTEFSKGLPFN